MQAFGPSRVTILITGHDTYSHHHPALYFVLLPTKLISNTVLSGRCWLTIFSVVTLEKHINANIPSLAIAEDCEEGYPTFPIQSKYSLIFT